MKEKKDKKKCSHCGIILRNTTIWNVRSEIFPDRCTRCEDTEERMKNTCARCKCYLENNVKDFLDRGNFCRVCASIISRNTK